MKLFNNKNKKKCWESIEKNINKVLDQDFLLKTTLDNSLKADSLRKLDKALEEIL